MQIGNRPALWLQDDATPHEDTLGRACMKILCVTQEEALKAALTVEDHGEAAYHVMPSGHVIVVSYPGACAIWGPEPVAVAPPAAEPWLVYTLTERGHGNVYLWWGPNHRGYTRCVDKAGRYTEEEARRIVVVRGEEVAVRLSDVLARTETVVPYSALESGGGFDETRTIQSIRRKTTKRKATK